MRRVRLLRGLLVFLWLQLVTCNSQRPGLVQAVQAFPPAPEPLPGGQN